jgi:hypothetical protein
MNHHLRRRAVLHAGLALGAGLLAPRAKACEFFAPNLRVYRPWTRATPPGADSAIVCVTFDQVTETDHLIGIETPLCEGAEIGGVGARQGLDLVIPAGRETVLTEQTTYLRLVGLKQPLLFGRSYPMNYVFEKGGVVPGDVDVDYDFVR